ncbi:hypothetical protein EN35_16640 [Rhodococcus qingshengii]|nr:hypothetical protein EN35_16640 [Rhodococcus qingshengii]
MAGMLAPCAINPRTSRSRALSVGPDGSLRRRTSPTNPAAILGGNTSRPAAQSSTALTISARVDSFGRNPAAPACRAWYTTDDSS